MGNAYIKETSVCMICGEPTRMHALICKRCRDSGAVLHRPKTDNERQIALINGRARGLHLSYGKYVAKYGDGSIK